MKLNYLNQLYRQLRDRFKTSQYIAQAQEELCQVFGVDPVKVKFTILPPGNNLRPKQGKIEETTIEASPLLGEVGRDSADRRIRIRFYGCPKIKTVDHEVTHYLHQTYNPSYDAVFSHAQKNIPFADLGNLGRQDSASDLTCEILNKTILAILASEVVAHGANTYLSNTQRNPVYEIHVNLNTGPLKTSQKLEMLIDLWKRLYLSATKSILFAPQELNDTEDLVQSRRQKIDRGYELTRVWGQNLYNDFREPPTLELSVRESENWIKVVSAFKYRPLDCDAVREKLREQFHENVLTLGREVLQHSAQLEERISQVTADQLRSALQQPGQIISA